MVNFILSMILFFLFAIAVIGVAVFLRFRTEISSAYSEFKLERSTVDRAPFVSDVSVSNFAEVETFVHSMGKSNFSTALLKSLPTYPPFDEELFKIEVRPASGVVGVRNIAPRDFRPTYSKHAEPAFNSLKRQHSQQYESVLA